MFVRRKSDARKPDHLRRGVNAHHGAAQHGAGNFGADLAIAAANIQNVLIAPQIEPGDELARPGLLHDRIRGVIGGIPPGSW